MFRVVLHVQDGALKFYSDELETDSQAKIWVDTLWNTSIGSFIYSVEHYDEYLGEWVVL